MSKKADSNRQKRWDRKGKPDQQIQAKLERDTAEIMQARKDAEHLIYPIFKEAFKEEDQK